MAEEQNVSFIRWRLDPNMYRYRDLSCFKKKESKILRIRIDVVKTLFLVELEYNISNAIVNIRNCVELLKCALLYF